MSCHHGIVRNTQRCSGFSGGYVQLCRIVFLLFLLLPTTASAYVDPGSAVVVVQMLMAAIAGFLFAFRRSVVNSVKNLLGMKQEDPESDPEAWKREDDGDGEDD